MSKRLFALVSVLALASMILAACGPAATPTAAPTGAPTEAPTGAPTTAPTEAPTEGAMYQCTDELGCVTIGPTDPVHLAFWGVLSGANSTLGEDSKRGVEIALDDAGGKWQGHDFLLTSEDGLCTPEGGATAASKLATDTSLVALVGSSCSDETVGGIAAITNAGLTTISPSNTRPVLTAADRSPDYAGYLRTAHSDAFQGKAVAEFAYNVLGAKTAATIHDGSSYAQALQQVFADNFTALGGTIVAQEAVTLGDTDMHPVLTTVAASNNGAAPDVLYYPVFNAEGGYLTAQSKEVPGLENTKLIGSDGMFSPDYVKGAGAAAEGTYLSSPDFSQFPEGYKNFVDEYNAKYGQAPIAIFHAHAYDATNIILAALAQVAVVEPDGTIYVPRKALRDAIYATKDFKGITGTLSCSASGDCGAPVIAVYQIVNSDAASWDPQSATAPNPKKVYP